MPARPRKKRPFVVAIDGPAGAGKSTVAKGVARALGIAHLDTGAMYRVITAKALREGVDVTEERALAALARRTDIEFQPGEMKVDGTVVGREIRTPRVSQSVSTVSAHAGVRKELVKLQRLILARGDIVAEGRDIGTVVCPDAAVKIFLTASTAERARRRHKELIRAGHVVSLAALKREIARRDALDSSRKVSPLLPARDALHLDSTGKSARQVIVEISSIAKRARDQR